MGKIKGFLKGAILTAAVVSMPFSNVMAEQTAIRDINSSSEYARESIRELAEAGIIQGDEKGNFLPQKAVTRGEMITMIVKGLDIDRSQLPEEATFRDVPYGHWAFEYVEAAYKAGIVQGISADQFGVDVQCSREQMAAMFVRSLGLEESVGAIYISYENINDLLDKAEVSDWAGKEVELAIKTGLMQGVGENRFHPKGIAKKEQVAVVTGRFIEGIESIKQEITAGTNKVKYSELYNVLKNNSQAAPYKGIIDLDFTINMTGRITGEKISVAADVYNMVNGENFHSTSVVSMKMFDLEPFTEEMEYLSLDGKFYEKNHETKAWEEKQDGQQIVEVSNGYGLVEQSFLDNFNMYLIENQGEEFSGSEKLTKYTVEMDKEAFGDVMLKEEIEGLGVSLDEMLDEDSIFRAEYFINSKGEIVKGTMDFTGAFDSGEETVDMNINMSILLLNRGQEYVIKIP